MPRDKGKRIVELITHHMVNINRNMRKSKVDWFVAEHSHLAIDLADLIDADTYGATGVYPTENFVREAYNRLVEEKAPFSVKELAVNGGDLIALGIEPRMRSEVLYELWRECVKNPVYRTREKALEYIARRSGK